MAEPEVATEIVVNVTPEQTGTSAAAAKDALFAAIQEQRHRKW